MDNVRAVPQAGSLSEERTFPTNMKRMPAYRGQRYHRMKVQLRQLTKDPLEAKRSGVDRYCQKTALMPGDVFEPSSYRFTCLEPLKMIS